MGFGLCKAPLRPDSKGKSMSDNPKEKRPSHIRVVGSEEPPTAVSSRLDFSQLAKFAADVVALNTQGLSGVSLPGRPDKEIRPAALASFKNGLIVKKLSPDTERTPVVPLRPTIKE